MKKLKEIKITKGCFLSVSNENWLIDKFWLIGFVEAEGSFTVAERGDLQFCITQGVNNLFILYRIKDFFGYGRVIKQSQQVFRYIVQDGYFLEKIIMFFNGYLILPKKKKQFNRFILSYNNYYGTNIQFIENLYDNSFNLLDNAWLSGFTDGDGCFSIVYNVVSKQFRIRFILSQKDDLNFLKEKINQGVVYYYKNKDFWEFYVLDIISQATKRNKNILVEPLNNLIIISYFQKYPLKTTKINSYALWFYIINQLMNNNLTPEKEKSLIFLLKFINNI